MAMSAVIMSTESTAHMGNRAMSTAPAGAATTLDRPIMAWLMPPTLPRWRSGTIMEVAACNGVSCAGDPFSGAIGFDPAALIRYLDENVLAQNGFEGYLSVLLAALNEAGALNGAVGRKKSPGQRPGDLLYDTRIQAG